MKKLSTIIKRVRKLAEQYPDAVYRRPIKKGWPESCSYSKGEVSNGPETTGCIVGQACKGYFSISEKMDTKTAHGLFEEVLNLKVKGTVDDLHWLSLVQGYQDDGYPWGKAVAYADE